MTTQPRANTTTATRRKTTSTTSRRTGPPNKSLAVGYKHDRSFVVRGSQIGVFKHTPAQQARVLDQHLQDRDAPTASCSAPRRSCSTTRIAT